MEDPRVQEAIQRLKTGEASEEDARIAFEAGYDGGPKTQEYYRELGLLNGPTVETPPQDVPPAETPTPDAMTGDHRFQAPTPDAMAGDPRFQAPPEASEPTNRIPNFSKYKDTDVFDRGIKAWSPLAPSIIKGGDMSGEAAGYRAAAGIEDKAAADNAKILQWNKQRATDNTLADKIAAAQASGQWRQNANALGAEGGASVVASQNQAVTPDIMAQKQYQSQQMNTATQNLAEVNARKLAAQDDRINADRTDYKTQVEESQNAYKTNLAIANDQQDQPKEEKKSEKPESAKPAEKKSEPVEQEQAPAHQAETNQQSDSVDTASQIVSDNQQLEELINRVEGINTARKNGAITPAQESEYSAIEAQFNELANKMGGAPRSLPPLYTVPKKTKPEDRFNSAEYGNQTAVVDPELSRINPELLYQRY